MVSRIVEKLMIKATNLYDFRYTKKHWNLKITSAFELFTIISSLLTILEGTFLQL